jgi:hypothetical protein
MGSEEEMEDAQMQGWEFNCAQGMQLNTEGTGVFFRSENSWHVESSGVSIGRTGANRITKIFEQRRSTRRLTRATAVVLSQEDSRSRSPEPLWDCEFHRWAFKKLRGKMLCPQHKNRVCKYVSEGVGNNCFRFSCKEGGRTFSMTEPQAVEACETHFDELLECNPALFQKYARTWTPPTLAANPRDKTTGYNVSVERTMKCAGSSKRRRRALSQFALGEEGDVRNPPDGDREWNMAHQQRGV